MKQHTTQVALGIIALIFLIYLVSLLVQSTPFGYTSMGHYDGSITDLEAISNGLSEVYTSIFYFAKIFGVFTILFGILLIWKMMKD